MIVKAYEQCRECKHQHIGDHEYIGGTDNFMLHQFFIHFDLFNAARVEILAQFLLNGLHQDDKT